MVADYPVATAPGTDCISAPDSDRERDGNHLAASLELRPHSIHSRLRKERVESNVRTANDLVTVRIVRNRHLWVRMNIRARVLGNYQRMSPGAEIRLKVRHWLAGSFVG